MPILVLIVIVWLVQVPSVTFATGQTPDYLVIRNDTFLLHNNPLETHPDKASLAAKFFNNLSTACWRGYIAYWQLDGQRLYLTNVMSCSLEKREAFSLDHLFGDEIRKNRVWANWFTGELVCSSGKLLRYYHHGYQSIYEHQTAYQVSKGIRISQQTFDNRKTKVTDYETNPEIINNLIYSAINWRALPIRPDSTHVVFVRIKSNPYAGKPVIEIVKSAGYDWDTEAVRVMKLIPEWGHDYVRGEFQSIVFYYPIRFSESNRKRYAK